MADIEYFYSAHSGFAYVGSARLMEIANAADACIVHRPFHLNEAMASIGSSPFPSRSQAHKDYYFKREIARWTEHRGIGWLGKTPTHHSNDYTFANRMLIAGLTQGVNMDQLSHAFLEAHWRDDADLADRTTLAGLARTVGVDPEPLLSAASSDQATAIHDKNTREAIDRSVFGSPTYFVKGDMFYGQDRLEFVERALEQPYSGTWPA